MPANGAPTRARPPAALRGVSDPPCSLVTSDPYTAGSLQSHYWCSRRSAPLAWSIEYTEIVSDFSPHATTPPVVGAEGFNHLRRSRAMFTWIVLPPTEVPLRLLIAASASDWVGISTKPNPRG